MVSLTVEKTSYPIAGTFTISRGSKTSADCVLVTLRDGEFTGHGECVPYARYNETVDGVVDLISSVQDQIAAGMDRTSLQSILPSGAARRAIDDAMWDLEAKRSGKRVWELLGLNELPQLETAYTISLGNPDKMRDDAQKASSFPLLKLKFGGAGDMERLEAVREGAPKSRLIVDANEAWTPDQLVDFGPRLKNLGVELIEQPLPASADNALKEINCPIALCADESCHDRRSLTDIVGKYSHINIKLDKTGGLTEALALADAAEAEGLKLMVGCMLGSSLAMAPAMLVGARADFVDLDGPLLLREDYTPALTIKDSIMHPPPRDLWG